MNDFPHDPPDASIPGHVALALREDLGPAGDLTAAYFLPAGQYARANVVARADGVLAGMPVAREVCRQVDAGLDFQPWIQDGTAVQAGTVVATIRGPVRALVTAERTLLNYLQRLSGIATLTNRFVAATTGTRAIILDTRKTTPGWRALEKYAVRCGGAQNHRMGLYDAVMVKDNHLACGLTGAAMAQAIRQVKAEHPGVWVEVEADTLEQVGRFLALPGVDRILLDNMSLDDMREAVAMARGRVPLEASGGVTLASIGGIAATGVDFISVGALTHSAVALDLALDFLPDAGSGTDG
jgi:nicotinate-nucleotide pyrophosphorylase (carboxylating)